MSKEILIENLMDDCGYLIEDDYIKLLTLRDEFKKFLLARFEKISEKELLNFALEKVGYTDYDLRKMRIMDWVKETLSKQKGKNPESNGGRKWV